MKRSLVAMALGALMCACGSAPAPSTPAKARSASPAVVEIAPPPAPAPLAAVVDDGLVDLLRRTAASVVVSSNVDNPRDVPGHLVDDRPDTAWNSATGDTRGAWIKFRVPRDVTVDHVLMNAGFDKVGSDGELFTMNLRIASVRVFRDEKPVGEVKLEPNVRGIQKIPVHAAGGEFRIEIDDYQRGTKGAAWDEICVSELRVMGAAPAAALHEAAPPLVTVAFFPGQTPPAAKLEANGYPDQKTTDERANALAKKRWPSALAFIDAWNAVMHPYLVASFPKEERHTRASGATGALDTRFASDANVLAVWKLHLCASNWSEERLAIETPRGVYVSDAIDTSSYNDPGCFGDTNIGITTMTPSARGLQLELKKEWSNSRPSGVDANGQPTGWTSSTDSAKIRDMCTITADAIDCKRTELSRECTVDKQTVACDSF